MSMPGAVCPLCGDAERMKKTRYLYGNRVCKKCVHAFANRRQVAFLIDWFAVYTITIVLGVIVATSTADDPSELDGLLRWLPSLAFFAFILGKDGFAGCSPGKKVMGVQAVDRQTNVPIGFRSAFLRNLPIFIPFGPLIIAFDLMDGPRIGDVWSKSKVIWSRYADHPVFTGQPLPEPSGFGPEQMALPPVVESANPYEPPRT